MMSEYAGTLTDVFLDFWDLINEVVSTILG